MKGCNELILDQETMREAVLEYLRRRMPTTALSVESVKAESGRGFNDGSFRVTVTEVEAPPANGLLGRLAS